MRHLCFGLFFLTVAGCGIPAGLTTEYKQRNGPAPRSTPFRNSTVYLRACEIAVVPERPYFRPPHPIRPSFDVHATLHELSPQQIVAILEDGRVFDRILTTIDSSNNIDYLMDLRLTAAWEIPWWTWAQLVDLWAHTMLLPTFGMNLVSSAELRLYSTDGRLVGTWSTMHDDTRLGTLWWPLWLRQRPVADIETEAAAEVLRHVLSGMR